MKLTFIAIASLYVVSAFFVAPGTASSEMDMRGVGDDNSGKDNFVEAFTSRVYDIPKRKPKRELTDAIERTGNTQRNLEGLLFINLSDNEVVERTWDIEYNELICVNIYDMAGNGIQPPASGWVLEMYTTNGNAYYAHNGDFKDVLGVCLLFDGNGYLRYGSYEIVDGIRTDIYENTPTASPTPEPKKKSKTCFSESATVEVLGRGSTTMAALQIGDKVLTEAGAYEAVYGWAHRDPRAKTDFYAIQTTKTKSLPLEVTGDHLLAIPGNRFVAAKSLRVDDALETGVEQESTTITEIKIAEKTGVYAPLTPSGTLNVNGVKASCYISVQSDGTVSDKYSHMLSHLSLSPIRMLCLGVSSRFCSEELMDARNGYAWYVKMWFAMTDWFDQKGFWLQVLIMIAYSVIVGIFWAFERMFGPTLAPTAMLTIVLVRMHLMKFQRDGKKEE